MENRGNGVSSAKAAKKLKRHLSRVSTIYPFVGMNCEESNHY
jgi:hypothetical protein